MKKSSVINVAFLIEELDHAIRTRYFREFGRQSRPNSRK